MCQACNPHLLALMRDGLDRRDFLKYSAALSLGAGLSREARAAQRRYGKKASQAPLAERKAGPADLIFHGGKIITVNDAMPRAEALAVRGGRVSAVGAKDAVLRQRGSPTKLVDLGGHTMLPGFIDAHMHTTMTFLDSWLDIGPLTTPSMRAALEKLRAAARQAKPGQWVHAQALDPSITPGEPFTLKELDAAAGDHPLLVVESNGHVFYANSRALRLGGITRDTPDAPRSRYVRDANGDLTGRIEEFAGVAPLTKHMPKQAAEEYATGVRRLFDRAAAAGCTGLHDCGIGNLAGVADLQAVRQVMDGDPPIRFAAQLVSTMLDKWIEMGIKPGVGTDRMRLVGIKTWSDGSNQGLTGYQREPYLNSTNRGALNYTLDELTRAIQRAHGLGWQVGVHANGDAAIDATLQAFETVLKKSPRQGHRHRIEHCSILHPEQIQKMVALALSPSFLIGHVHYWGRAFRDRLLGPARSDFYDPCASALKAGLRISLHSDYNVTQIEPLRYIENAVTRVMREGGGVLNPAERITPMQAIKAVTLDAAWQSQMDSFAGSLEVGKYADLVILEKDPTRVDPTTIKSIQVIETWLEGTRRYRA